MISVSSRLRSTILTGFALMLALALPACAQKEVHGRKYKKLEPASNIIITVEKATNGKAISNAAVIFKVEKQGKVQGTMEVKTDPDGEAKVDIIEIGSHVRVQVIADGYATSATEFDVVKEEHNLLIKMEKPRAQVSAYQNNDGKASQRPAGVQEPPPVATVKKQPTAPYTPLPVVPAPPMSAPK